VHLLVLSLPWELQRRLFFTAFVFHRCLFDALAPFVRGARAHRQSLGYLAIGRFWISSKVGFDALEVIRFLLVAMSCRSLQGGVRLLFAFICFHVRPLFALWRR